MARSSRNKSAPEVNAGSMADIAFLLLIFFLVTTQIAEDKGIRVMLPPWSDEEPDITKLKTRNVFSVLVNAQNQLLVRGEVADIGQLRERAKEFISNPRRMEDLAEDPKKAIISLKNDRGTNYKTYLTVYNELKAAYNELWNDLSQQLYEKDYTYLSIKQKKIIKERLPLVISEAEPSDFGG